MNRCIAILITSHNRREKTLECLRSLARQSLPNDLSYKIYLVDDGSSDNTAQAVRSDFPDVFMLHGDGSLYWNGGMRRAFAEAMKGDYDFYLWLNDDTILYEDALRNLLLTYGTIVKEQGREAIIVGSTRDEATGMLTYGGVVRKDPLKRLRFDLVTPSDLTVECETMNGNCVLIPRAVAREIGNLDGAFTHAIGDFDYGLKARKAGCRIWVMPGYAGTCALPSGKGTFLDVSLTLMERLHRVTQLKGLPFREWMLFAKRYGGPLWFIYGISPYMKIIINYLFSKTKIVRAK